MENIVSEIKKIIDESIKIVNIDGKSYTNQDLSIIRDKARAAKIIFNDLNSIVELVKREKGMFTLPLYINIENQNKVSVFSSMDSDKEREIPYATESNPREFSYGRFYNYEDFIIAIRSQFVQNTDSANLLQLLKKITNNNSVETEDDGITQKITASQGLQLNKSAIAQPIMKLSPFRTFSEVEQPTSEFLFRVREGGYALFEADGGAWKLEAKSNIRKYFERELSEEIKSGEVVVVC